MKTWTVFLGLFFLFAFPAFTEQDSIATPEKASHTFYLVGAHGHVEKWEGTQLLLDNRIAGLSRRLCVCRQAVLSPSGDRLAVSTAQTAGPVRLLMTKNLEEVDLSDIPLDKIPILFQSFFPIGLCMPNERHILVADEFFETEDGKRFSAAVIDLDSRQALPIDSTRLGLSPLGAVSVSPETSNDVYVVDSRALHVLDLNSRLISRNVEFGLQGWSDLHEVSFDWDSKRLVVILTNHAEDSAETLRLQITLDTLELSMETTENPWSRYDVEESSPLGHLLSLYERGPIEGRRLPLIDERLARALPYLTESMVLALPFKPDVMFLSPDGTRMVCADTVSEKVGNTKFTHFLSDWVLVDLPSGEVLIHKRYPEEITCVAFQSGESRAD